MLRIWRNPEFVRHVRAELRPSRMLSALVVAIVFCLLVGLYCWAQEKSLAEYSKRPFDWLNFLRGSYFLLLGIEGIALSLWCAFTCGNVVATARDRKTFDFQRTTRLTSAELAAGMLFGVPAMGYFVVGCTVPFAMLAALASGIPISILLWTYVLVLAFAVFLSLAGLWFSILVARPSPLSLGFLALLLMGLGFARSPFPGAAAISILPALLAFYDPHSTYAQVSPTLFGKPVSLAGMSIFLYLCLGAWLWLMVVRNLKRESEDIQLLSRWQAVGFAAFLNSLFYALLDPKTIVPKRTGLVFIYGMLPIRPEDVAGTAVALNAVVLYAMGIAILIPSERLKTWWRSRRTGNSRGHFFSENGLPWPWLVLCGLIAYALLLIEALALRARFPVAAWQLGIAAIQFLAFLVFACRDSLFLQWCELTRLRRPVLFGFLYLCLYYAGAGILAAFAATFSVWNGRLVLSLLTPFSVFDSWVRGLGPMILAGTALQVPVIMILVAGIRNRLRRPARMPVPAAAG